MRVIISGMAAVGKSSLARRVAEKYNLLDYSAGETLKKIAEKSGFKTAKNWWETEEGFEFYKNRKLDSRFDKELDEITKKTLDTGDTVVTAWTMPWIYQKKGCLKVWLKASLKKRAQRMMNRDGIPFQNALKKVKQRDSIDKELLFSLYGIKLEKDLTPFDLVLNTEQLTARAVELIVFDFIGMCESG